MIFLKWKVEKIHRSTSGVFLTIIYKDDAGIQVKISEDAIGVDKPTK